MSSNVVPNNEFHILVSRRIRYIYSNNKKYENVMNNEYLCKLAICKLGELFIIYDILTYLLERLKLTCYLRMHGR